MRADLRASARIALVAGMLTIAFASGDARAQFVEDLPEPESVADEDVELAEDDEETGLQRRPEEASEKTQLDVRTQIDRQLVGKPIGRVQFDCDLPLCQNPANVEELVDLSGLYVGQPFTSEAMLRAETRLSKTGFFESIRVTKRLTEGAVFIDIRANGATLIRDVSFDDIDTPPFRSDLEKVLIYRQGQPFRGGAEKRRAQIESLKLLYEREGHFGTEIDILPLAIEGREHQVDILISIDKGKARKICDVGMRGVSAMPYVEAREYLLSRGSFFASRLRIFDENFTSRGFRDGQEALIQEYRRRGYFQARIVDKAARFKEDGECVTVVIDLVEGPRWELEFDGVERFSRADLVEELPFFESGYVDAEEIRRAEEAIEELYATRGHPFARVSAREVRRDRLDRVIQFEIDEGPQLEIREIVFEGNDSIEEPVLREVMSTREFALFDVGGYLQTGELLGDFNRIEALYRERGFNKATVEGYRLEIVDDGEGLRVTIVVDENDRTVIRRVDVDGNRKIPDGTLIDAVTSKRESAFVPLAVKGDQTKLSRQYSALGYPLAKITTRCFLMTGEEVKCEAPRMPTGCIAKVPDDIEGRCSWNDDRDVYSCDRVRDAERCVYEEGVLAGEVRILHTIEEGPFVRLGPRLLKGNFETQRSVIYREIPFQNGDPLDTQKIIQAQGNLRQLNVFDSINIQTIGLDKGVTDQEVAEAALLINVEEAETEFLDFKFGFELREPFVEDRQLLLTGEAQYTNRNLFGLAQGLQPRIIGAIDTLEFVEDGFSESAIGTPGQIDTLDFLFGGEILYTHPRFLKDLLGIDKLYLTIAPFYLLDLLGVTNRNLLREEWGVRAEFRKNLSEVLDRLFFKLGLEFKQISTFAPDSEILRDGTRIFSPRRTQGKLEPDIALDRRDSPLNPKAGYFLRAEPSIVSGDALGKGGESFGGDSFLRLRLTASFFVPLWRKTLVFAQAIRAGQVVPLFGRETPIPEDERFFLGGVRSVRAFADDSLGPVNDNQVPTGGEFFLNYNAELRYPLIPQFSIYGAWFFDAGILADCFSDREDGFERRSCYEDAFGDGPGDVRLSAGLGLRALIFDQIPILFDYGIILDRRPGESFGQVHLNVGYTFD